MSSELGDFVVCWTARLAVAVYVTRLYADVAGWPIDPGKRANRERVIRGIWTLGCGIYLLHVAAAFQFIHSWNHAAAAAHTARQTAAVTGWNWSGGLWINYAFTLWWPLDVIWSWRRGIDRLPCGYIVGLHALVGFLMFNATVVFGPPFWRWVAVTVVAGLILAAIDRRRQTRF